MSNIDPDDFAVCIDCTTPQQGDIFTDIGKKGRCKYCGGPMKAIDADSYAAFKAQAEDPVRRGLL